MSFDNNDPRLTAYVLDEMDDPNERAAMDAALENDAALRAAMDELANASRTLEHTLKNASAVDDCLVPEQRADVELRAAVARPRRARVRRRLVYATLAVAASLTIVTALTVPGVIERAKVGQDLRVAGAKPARFPAASPAPRASEPSSLGLLRSPASGPADAPAATPNDALGSLDEFQLSASGSSASGGRDGLSVETESLETRVGQLEEPQAQPRIAKGNLQNVQVGGSSRIRGSYYSNLTPDAKTDANGQFDPSVTANGRPGGAAPAPGNEANLFGKPSVGAVSEAVDSLGGGGYGGTTNAGVAAGSLGANANKTESGWAYDSSGARALGLEEMSKLESLGYFGDRNEAESRNLHRKITGYAVTDLDGDGINERVELYVNPPETLSFLARQDANRQSESYAPIVENQFIQVSQLPLSTFGLDVDTASYANVRRFLNDGQLPPPNAVRVEEFVNAFQYEYPTPTDGHSVAVRGEIAGCPWNPEHRLARIAVKAREIPFESQPPLRLTFLIDVSGSMQDNNKLPLLRESMKALTRKLRPSDQIAIVTYRDMAQRVMSPTPCSSAESICATIDSLCAEGSTNGAGGIELAYAAAKEQFNVEGLNRVILATDGDFNVGETENAELIRRIEEHAKSGVFLTVLGFGIDNLKDDRLEGLANKGNGNYYYIDSFAEANKVLVDRMAGTISVAAKDAKIQVEFNPAKIGAYRLLGYENRALAAQDFNDDRKDAGDLGAGHTVTALYELVPVGVSIGAPGVDDLKYQPTPVPPTNDNPETMTVKLRYKEPNANESKRIDLPLTDTGLQFENTPGDFQFASAAAAFAMLLRNSQYAGSATLDMVQQIAEASASGTADRTEFVSLVVAAKPLISRQLSQLSKSTPSYRSLVRENPFSIYGSVGSDNYSLSTDVTLDNIIKWSDGAYRAEITTKLTGKSKRYKEGEVFENFKLMSIDPANRSVTIYSSAHDKSFELKVR
ncbi:MAG: VWA domain-containing protein [Candidatus Hydrogenedentes bacterium]|nr:VWA domain-containing protein [Candidatus Hydrogenedentota bacterium]